MNNFPRTGIHCEKNSDKIYRDRNLFNERLQQKTSQNEGGNGHF